MPSWKWLPRILHFFHDTGLLVFGVKVELYTTFVEPIGSNSRMVGLRGLRVVSLRTKFNSGVNMQLALFCIWLHKSTLAEVAFFCIFFCIFYVCNFGEAGKFLKFFKYGEAKFGGNFWGFGENVVTFLWFFRLQNGFSQKIMQLSHGNTHQKICNLLTLGIFGWFGCIFGAYVHKFGYFGWIWV